MKKRFSGIRAMLLAIIFVCGCGGTEKETKYIEKELNPPEAPSLLSADSYSSSQIDLSWQDNSDNEDGFEVWRKVQGGTWGLVEEVLANQTDFSDTGLRSETTYFYMVSACNIDGCSDYSSSASATPLSPPLAPLGLSAFPLSYKCIALMWFDNSDNEESFIIERDDGSGFFEIVTVPANQAFYFDDGLFPQKSYTYRIRACNSQGCSDYSNSASAITETERPLPPAKLSVGVFWNNISLSWQDNSDNEESFIIERDDGSGFKELINLPANQTAYRDSGLVPNILYTYRIKAFNYQGCSAYSNEASATSLGTYGGSKSDEAYSIQQTADGGYIVAGHTEPLTLDYDFWVIKLDSSGNITWDKTYGGIGQDKAYSIQQTADGGYIVAGYIEPLTDYDFWVIKLGSSGNITWDKTYGGSGEDLAYSIQQTTGGGYIVAGVLDFGAGTNDAWVIELDSSGNITWDKTYGGLGYKIAYSIQQTTGGGYIVAGTFGGDAWVIKLDSSGNITWDNTYSGGVAYSIQQTTGGGYIVAGSSGNYAWVIKLDPDGNITWDKTYGGSGWQRANSIQQTTDGGYIVAGVTDSFGAGNYDFWVIKLDSSGNITWDKTYGGSGNEEARSIQQTTDGGYIVAGKTDSFGAGNEDFWVIKIDENGNF